MYEFLEFCYYKVEAIIKLIFSHRFLVITGGGKGLYAIRGSITVGDGKEIIKYLNRLTDETITEHETKQALVQVKEILSGKK